MLNPNYLFAHDQLGIGLAFQGRFKGFTLGQAAHWRSQPLNIKYSLQAAAMIGLKLTRRVQRAVSPDH